MADFVDKNKVSEGAVGIDFVFSDGDDFLFSNATDFVFIESTVITPWTDKSKV